jgi:uncharacterized protein
MWLRVVFAGIVWLAGCVCWRAEAASMVYWCDAAQAYYPAVPSCPIPWRPVPVGMPQAAQPLPTPIPAAAPPVAPPQRPSSDSAATQHGDALDPWCKKPATALNVAVCSDPDLRALAVDRLHAFNAARSRLAADQQKELAADQNGWAASSAASCGLSDDAPPALPLDPTLKDCLTDAGRARLAYLQTYGTESKDNKDNSAPDAASAATGEAPANAPPRINSDGTAKSPVPAIGATPVRSQLNTAAAPPWAAPGAADQPAAQ